MYSRICHGELCLSLKNGLFAVNRIFCYLDLTSDSNEQDLFWALEDITDHQLLTVLSVITTAIGYISETEVRRRKKKRDFVTGFHKTP
jgi:hypothetical protein